MRGSESQDLNLDVPNSRSQIQRIAAVDIGIADHLHVALPGGHSSSRNYLIRGVYIPDFLSGMQHYASQQQDQRKTPQREPSLKPGERA
jgi:hypothetical protein